MYRFGFPLILAVSVSLNAQMTMPMEQHQSMNQTMNMGDPTRSLPENILRHMASGTDVEPNSTVPPMLMEMKQNWMLMLHGQASIVEQQQTGPRGEDKLFSANWIMPMAQRSFERGELTLRAMFSLEPATISGRYYPELFQQGETAFGRPIVDGQHPHNLFMELAALYDYRLGEQSLLSLYAAPVGDPALGPVAFPHRAAASEDPLAPLGHHLEDSTHIAYEVLTGGVTMHKLRIEASLERALLERAGRAIFDGPFAFTRGASSHRGCSAANGFCELSPRVECQLRRCAGAVGAQSFHRFANQCKWISIRDDSACGEGKRGAQRTLDSDRKRGSNDGFAGRIRATRGNGDREGPGLYRRLCLPDPQQSMERL